MPRVSGRFDSAAKYLMVWGLPSSRTVKSSLREVGHQRAVLVFDVEEKPTTFTLTLRVSAGGLLFLGFLIGRARAAGA